MRKQRIADETITAVREQGNLLAVVEEHVALKRAGTSHKGLCPFHDEKTPSFTVNTMTSTYKCFGCGEGGDIIDFVQEITHEDFRSVVEYLAEKTGLTVVYTDGESPEDGEREKQARLYQVNEAASGFFLQQLLSEDEAEGARAELTRRNFTGKATAERFDCGYAPNSTRALINVLRKEGFTDEEMVEAGLFNATDNGSLRPRFRGRLVWTIRNAFGRAVGFGARRLNDADPIEAKFINTSETPVYKKSEVLYGFDKARKAIARNRHAIVVEGYTDVMAMHLAGVETAVASCGTAFTSHHLAILRRIVGEGGEITFALDDDTAGRKATLSIYDLSKGSVKRLTALGSSNGMDPDECRQQRGDQALAELVTARIPLLQSVIHTTVSALPTESPEDRLVALETVLPLLSHANDPLLRREYGEIVANMLRFRREDVLSRLGEMPTVGSVNEVGQSAPSQTLRLDPEVEVIKAMVQSREAAASLADLVRWNLAYPVDGQIVDGIDAALADPSHRQWFLKVRDHCEGRAQQVVDQIVDYPLPVPPEKVVEYATAMAERLESDAMEKEEERLMEVISTASTQEARDRAFTQLMGLT